LVKKTKYKRKTSTSNWYNEFIKAIFSINGINLEIKFTSNGNKNQNWINAQFIYAAFEKGGIWYCIRLINEWYITEEQIKTVVNDLFENLQNLIDENPEKCWTSKIDYLEELWNDFKEKGYINKKFDKKMGESNIIKNLKPLLIKYYKSISKEIKLKNWKIVWTTERWKTLIESWFYKEINRRAT
jgi:hypothetical protein